MRIDDELAGLIPPLSEAEYSRLEANILAEGCRDALVVWGDILVDGHNRYRICREHGLPYKTVQKDFADKNAATLWILHNQLGRRNLTDFQRIEMVRKCEEAVKAQAQQRMLLGKADPSPKLGKGRATEELGRLAGVSHNTYEHATAVIDNAPKAVTEAVRRNELSINAGYEVTKLPEEEQAEITERIEHGENPQDVVTEVRTRSNPPHVSRNSGNNEWYTPSDYIELAREVMGGIDLDPASSEKANEVVQASRYYTSEDDGLSQEWSGKIWLNPPYSSELITRFTEKFLSEKERIEQAIILVNNATETEWFSKLASVAKAVCFPKGRVRFYAPDGKIGAPLQGQALLYVGEHADCFVEKFRIKGWCALLE